MWKVSINYEGQIGEYSNQVSDESTDKEIIEWVWEDLRSGNIAGVTNVSRDLSGYKVARDHEAKTMLIRPEVIFG